MFAIITGLLDEGVIDPLEAQVFIVITVTVMVAYVLTRGKTKKRKDVDLPYFSPPPGNLGLPFVGNVEFALAYDKREFLMSREGLSRFRLLGQELVLVPYPELAEKLFRLEGTCVNYGNSMPTFSRVIGDNSVFCLHGDPHKRLRNSLISCFRPTDLLKTGLQIQEICSDRLSAWCDAQSFVANAETEELSFDLGMSFIGVDVKALSHEGRHKLMSAVQSFGDAILSVPINLGKYSQFGRGIEARRTLLAFVDDAIRTRKMSDQTTKRSDLLQRMVDVRDEQGDELSVETLQDTILSFVVASHDTTKAEMLSFIMNMCEFPDIQQKAHEHVRDVLGESSAEYLGRDSIQQDKWEELDYIEQVVMESRRFHPTLAISSVRKALKDFVLDGSLITKGSTLLIDVVSRSRSERYWTKPNEFDPERFNRSNPSYRHAVSLLQTFGGGSKQCIGKGFAILEMKIFATLLLRDYTLEFVDPANLPSVKYPSTMTLDGPLPVKITRRNKTHTV